MKLYFKKKIKIYSIPDLMGSEEEARRVVVPLYVTEARCLLSLCTEDDTVSRDSLFSLPVGGTVGDMDAVRTFVWEVEICPRICTFSVNYEATYMFW